MYIAFGPIIHSWVSNYPIEPIEVVQKMILESEYWTEDDICYEIAAIRDSAPDDPFAPLHLLSCYFSEFRSLSKLVYTNTTDLWENKELTERDWKIILTGAQLLKFSPDEVVLRAGVQNKHLYRIVVSLSSCL